MSNSEETLRERVKDLLRAKGVTDGQFARDMKLTKVWASRWLRKGKGAVPVKRLDALADYFGVDVLTLLTPVMTTNETGVQKSTPVTPSVQTPDVNSASNPKRLTVGGPGGTEVDSLKHEIAELRRQLAGHVDTIRAFTEELAALAHGGAATGRLPKTATRKPGRR